MKKNGLICIAICSIITVLVFVTGNKSKAPEALFKIVDGRQISLAGLSGRPVLVNFWASTCSICKKEMPDLVRLYNQYHPDGLEIIGVIIYYNAPNQALEFLADNPLPYPIALDVDKTLTKAFVKVHYTPTTFLISPEGEIVERYTGPLPINKTEQQIHEMLTNKVAMLNQP